MTDPAEDLEFQKILDGFTKKLISFLAFIDQHDHDRHVRKLARDKIEEILREVARIKNLPESAPGQEPQEDT